MSTASPSRPAAYASLQEMPLWRLLVALDDAERAAGPKSQTARTLARIIRDRMREDRGSDPTKAGGPGRAA